MTISKLDDYLLTVKGYFKSKNFMNKSQYFSNDEIKEYQFKAIYKLLNDVCRYIPYYKNLFWEYDFDVSNFDNLNQIKKLPVLNKQKVLDSPHEFISATYALKGLELSTSGSSGTPLKTYASKNQWII